MKKLSREQMKSLNGGGGRQAPPSPNALGNKVAPGGDGTGCYMCCWSGTTSCSACSFSYSGASCVTGASLSTCGGC